MRLTGFLTLVVFLTALITRASGAAEQRPGIHFRLATGLAFDDNIRATEKNTESDIVLSVLPGFEMLFQFGKHQTHLSYQGAFAHFFSHPNEGYLNHNLAAGVLLDLSPRLDVEFEGGYSIASIPRDEGRTSSADSPDRSKTWTADANIAYGQPTSQGMLIGSYSRNQIRFTNNNQGARDRNRNEYTGTFLYRILPKTRVLLETSFARFDYLRPNIDGSRLDSEEYKFLTGLKWDISEKDFGEFKIGYLQKNFDDDDSFKDGGGLTLSLDMLWAYNTVSEIAINMSRTTDESDQEVNSGNSGGTVNSTIAANHSYRFRPRINLTTGFSLGREEFISDNREDDRWEISVGASYDLIRWLTIGLDYTHETRSSNISGFGFDRNVLMLNATTLFD